MKESMMFRRSARKPAGLVASAAFLAAFATVGWSTSAEALPCTGAVGGTNCTANDVKVATISVTNVIEPCDGTAGDTFTFDGALNVQSSATRYDIGFFIGADPAGNTDTCDVIVIPPATADLDGDQCGDTGSGNLQVPVASITALCQDGDGDGFFDVNECSTWQQNSDGNCTGPADAAPGTSSKCNCDVVPTDLPVPHCDTNVDCDDGNLCTTDVCDPTPGGAGNLFGCTFTNNAVPCEDGLFCNGVDNCSAGGCNTHAGDPCAAGGVCGDNCQEDTDSCFDAPGTLCRATNGVCDTPESCTGTSGACPADDFLSGNTCRGSNGICDAAETCTGSSANCPGDTFADEDLVCRGSNGICDVAENCTGTAAACPGDGFVNEGTTCRGSGGVCDIAEECTGSSASCPDNDFLSGNTCRGSNGVCDVAEACSGASAACPADDFVDVGTTCRGSNGICDVAEACTGSSASCPADGFASTTLTCRAADGVCDLAEKCTGASATCPEDSTSTNDCDDGIFCNGADHCVEGACTVHDGDPCVGGGVCGDLCQEETDSCFESSGTVCRDSNGVCDTQETCTGSSGDCPADSFQEGNTCRSSSGVCDPAETCSGSAADCPADAFLPSSTTCRASGGVCDQAENCTGSEGDCPTDTFQEGNTCRASGGVCDTAETCSGSAAACPADAFVSSATTCRASGGVCDVAENCTGTSAACPNNTFVNGTTCRSSSGVCDVAESCSGTAATCPNDAFVPSTTVCRADAGDCDVAERCTGSSGSCPANGFDPQGSACTTDNNVCTNDVCNGSGVCQHNNNTVSCDDGLFCTVGDACAAGQCHGTPRVCGDEFSCTDDSCNEATDSCVFAPDNEDCEDEDICTTDICTVSGGCQHIFSCKDICRRFGWWSNRAGDGNDEGDINVVQRILDFYGGLDVCGQHIDATSIGDSVAGLGLDSALEGLCVRPQHVEQRSLYRELVTTALNCAMSGAGGDDFCDTVVTRFVDVTFSECNDLCSGDLEGVSDSEVQSLADSCTRQLSCYNSGGKLVNGKCAVGQCEVTRDLCGADFGACPPVASIPVPLLQTCQRFEGNCRDEEFCQEGINVCPDHNPKTSGKACREAKSNECTIDFCSIDED